MVSLEAFEKYEEGVIQDLKFYRLYFYQDLSGMPLSTIMKSEFDFESAYKPWDSTPEGWRVYKQFKTGYESDILDKIGNNQALLGLMKKIYLNGVYKTRLNFESLHIDVLESKFENDSAKAFDNTVYTDLFNRVHGHQTVTTNLRSFFERSTELILPKIDRLLYNLSGEYFGEWDFEEGGNESNSENEKFLNGNKSNSQIRTSILQKKNESLGRFKEQHLDIDIDLGALEIALFLYYSRKTVTEELYGRTVYNRMSIVKRETERRGYPGSETKLQNQISRLKKVIGILDSQNREEAKDDLATLESHL